MLWFGVNMEKSKVDLKFIERYILSLCLQVPRTSHFLVGNEVYHYLLFCFLSADNLSLRIKLLHKTLHIWYFPLLLAVVYKNG